MFRGVLRGSGASVLILMILVGSFLAYRAAQALRIAGWSFLTTRRGTRTARTLRHRRGQVGTFLIARVAIIVALPLAIGAALFISEYAPQAIQRLLVTMVDLMAAVPA